MKPEHLQILHSIPHENRSFLKNPQRPTPVLQSQTETRSALQKILRGLRETIETAAVGAILLGMLVLCLPNALAEWLKYDELPKKD